MNYKILYHTAFLEIISCFTAKNSAAGTRILPTFQENPLHPSLQFKRVHPVKMVYSARINVDYRVLGILDADEIIWFWIGLYSEYDKLLNQL